MGGLLLASTASFAAPLLAAAPALLAQAADPGLCAGVEQKVRDVLTATGVPSASVAVVRDGKVACAAAWGDAKLDPKTAAAPAMRYSIGSVSKQFTAAAILMLAEEGKPLSELVAPLRRYAASGEINRRVADIPGLLAALESDHAGRAEISKLDGLLVRYPDWWFNVRASNTEPVVRLNLEAADEPAMRARRDAILARIEQFAPPGGGAPAGH